MKICCVPPRPVGMAPPLLPSGQKQGTRLTRVCPTLTTRVPSGWYHIRLGWPGTSSLGRKSKAVTIASLGWGGVQ